MTLRPPSPTPNTSKSGTQKAPGSKAMYGGLHTKPVWVFGASSVPPAVPTHALWRYTHPLAQHRSGPSREHQRHHSSRQAGLAMLPPRWACLPAARTGCSRPCLQRLVATLQDALQVVNGQGWDWGGSWPRVKAFRATLQRLSLRCPQAWGDWVAPSTWGSTAQQKRSIDGTFLSFRRA